MKIRCIHLDMKSLFPKAEYLLTELEQLAAMGYTHVLLEFEDRFPFEAYPDMAEEIQAFAATSNTLTNADGLYMSLLIGLPLTEWLYRKFSKNHPQKGVKPVEAAEEIVVEKEDI